MLRRHLLKAAALSSVLASVVPFSSAVPLSSAEEAAAPPPIAGFRADYLMELGRLRERTLALAGEIPAPRYASRPAPELHSLGECFAEMTAASRRILIGMDRPAPEAGEPSPEGEKKWVASELATVLDAVESAARETSDEDLEAPFDFLGRRWTTRALFLLLLGQVREGLGHVAAHAEDVGIVPPWLRQKRVSDASDD